MSSTTTPISPQRFASALTDLPISALHAKISELSNSISHLQKSNTELEEYVRKENDKDCYEALMENKEVIRRMEERIELVRREIVEVRGLPLMPVESEEVKAEVDGEDGQGNGEGNGEVLEETSGQTSGGAQAEARGQTNVTNRIAGAEEEDGVFL